MKYYQRAFRYIRRKKAKSFLLLLVLFVANSMILCTFNILHATEQAKADLQEKTESKLVCDVVDIKALFTGEEIDKIAALDGVQSVNRISSDEAVPVDFRHIASPESGAEKNGYVHVFGYDDMETDGPFAEKQLRLVEGEFPEHGNQVVIDKVLADYNGLTVGDSIVLENGKGNQVTGEISGLYLSGSEEKQGKNVEGYYRIENQIYGSQEWFQAFSEDVSFESAVFYVDDPDLLSSLEQQVSDVLGEKAEVVKSDTLYQSMKVPLNQISRVVILMLWMTIGTSILIVTLLLSMWMRARKRETAVYISMGETKTFIYLQYLMETMMIFGVAVAGSLAVGTISARGMKALLLAGQENTVDFEVCFRGQDACVMVLVGTVVLLIAVGISLMPVLRTNPKDTLAEMEG